MDDAALLSILVFMFGLNYALTIGLWAKFGKVQSVITVLCREHQRNHGGEGLQV